MGDALARGARVLLALDRVRSGTIGQMSKASTMSVRHDETLPVPVRGAALTVTRGYAVKHEGPSYPVHCLFAPRHLYWPMPDQ